MISLTIDGRAVSVTPGTTIWDAARQLGIDIPVLCHQPHLRPVGVCRLCVVDVGSRTLAASCARMCEPGIEVLTYSDLVQRQRRTLLQLLLAEHPVPCEREKTLGDCELEALGRQYNAHGLPFSAARVARGVDVPLSRAGQVENLSYDKSSRVIAVDHAACILCDRCIRACDEIQCNDVIGRAGKGTSTHIAFDLDVPMGESTCVSCGECAAACPTGALTHKSLSLPLVPRSQMTATGSVCPYCGVGCTTTYWTRDNKIVLA